jgi:hypothetical protein
MPIELIQEMKDARARYGLNFKAFKNIRHFSIFSDEKCRNRSHSLESFYRYFPWHLLGIF